MRAIILGTTLAVTLAAMSSGAAAEKYLIDSDVWAWYQKYLGDIGKGKKPGAFAITKNGRGAYYTYCQDIRCAGGVTYGQDALNNCERSSGTECVVFAVRDDIKVDYEIRGGASNPSPGTEVAALAPAPVSKITVPASVSSEIAVYLRNAQGSGRSSALAIAKDGTAVGSASCPIVGTIGSGYCNHTQGDIQAQVSREAVKRCGGPSNCLLLYVGTQKQSNIEIVASSATADSSNDPAPQPVTEPTVASVPKAPEIKAADPPKVEVPVAPATRILVTAEVQEKIDVYLRNAQSAARVWAFAVTKDGTDGAMASCAAGSTYAGGRSCYPVMGTKEELVKREALVRCGGPSDCILLYLGHQKQGNFEIVVQ